MKKYSLLLLITFFHSLTIAQFYIRPFTGYTWSLNPQKVETGIVINNIENIYVDKFKFGKGWNLGMALGYKINNHWFIELNGNTQLFNTFEISHKQLNFDSLGIETFSYSNWGYLGTFDYKFRVLQFSPQIAYSVDINKFSFYLRIGPNFLKSKATLIREFTDWGKEDWSDFYSIHIKREITYSGGIQVGLQSSLGIDYHLSNHLNLSFEFLLVNTNYVWKNSEITRYEIDGVDHLYEVEDRTLELDKETNTINYSQIGFNISVRYFFKL